MNAALLIAALLGGAVCLVALVLIATAIVTTIRDRRADRFTASEVARGAVEVYPATPLGGNETAAQKALREAYAGTRPIRKVTR